MSKEEILKKIHQSLVKEKDNKARNSMGNSESYYNSFYLIGKCFTAEELFCMSEPTLNQLIRLADFASEVFY